MTNAIQPLMNRSLVLLAVGLLTAPLRAAEVTPSLKDEITAAIKKLAVQSNYCWKTTIEFGGFPPNVSEGKTDAEGLVQLSLAFGENKVEAFLKEHKGAVKRPEEGWQSLDELAADAGDQPGPRRGLGRMLRNYHPPAAEAKDLVAKCQEPRKDGDAYVADLTEDGAKALLVFGRRSGTNREPKDAKGSVKFWVHDGVLAKYEFKVQGTVNFNNSDRDIDRTSTVEIKDVGAAKLEVPEEARKKLP